MFQPHFLRYLNESVQGTAHLHPLSQPLELPPSLKFEMSRLIALASQLPSPSTVLNGSQLQETSLTQVASGVLVVAVFTYLFKWFRARPLLDGVPEPVRSFTHSLKLPLIGCVSLQSGHSLLWGHQRTAAEKSVGTAFATWMDELHAQVFKIRGALFNPDIVSEPLGSF